MIRERVPNWLAPASFAMSKLIKKPMPVKITLKINPRSRSCTILVYANKI
jgi:hypothetical protein